MLKRNYNLEDPEQKTGFYNAAARKLLEFPVDRVYSKLRKRSKKSTRHEKSKPAFPNLKALLLIKKSMEQMRRVN